MRRILISVLILLCLCSCSKNEYIPSVQEVVKYPDKSTELTVNGYKEQNKQTYSNASESPKNSEPIIYYVNEKSKKFHLPECTYAKKLNEENASLETDYEALISYGYEPCKVCNP